MLSYIYMAIGSFRGVFSHNSTWLVFSMVVLGFLGAGAGAKLGVKVGKRLVKQEYLGPAGKPGPNRFEDKKNDCFSEFAARS